MIRSYFFLLSIILICNYHSSEASVNPAKCLPESAEVSDWEIVETRNIRSDTELFDYMNGGAEFYRAFNFRRLSVREFKSPDEGILKVEIYMFRDSADAYGVYTMLPLGESLDIGNGGSYDLGVVRFWKGKFLCKVYFSRIDWNRYKQQIINVARVVDVKISDSAEPPAIMNVFPKENLVINGLHYFYDYIALKNLFYITYTNVLSLNMKTEVVLGEYLNLQAENLKLLLIKYPSNTAFDSAYSYFAKNYLHIESESEKKFPVIKELDPSLFVQLDRVENYLLVGFEQSHSDLLKNKISELKSNLQNYLKNL